MIENRELYSFEDADDPIEPENTETGAVDAEVENDESGSPKFLGQTVIAVLCLVITIAFCRNEQPWSYWFREKLHYAINASTETTFGVLWNSEFLQNIAQNVNNFIRLEKTTQTLSELHTSPLNNDLIFRDSVWPVPGNIINEYDSRDPYSSGVLMETTSQARVIAVATGKISRINRVTDGWALEIDHGSGWSSIYQPIVQIQIGLNQPVKTGQIVGKLGNPGKSGNSKLFLEIRHNGQPVNPRTVIR